MPAKLREQPDGGLLNKLVFGIGVGAHSLTFQVVLDLAELFEGGIANGDHAGGGEFRQSRIQV